MGKSKSQIRKGINNCILKKKLGEKCIYCKCENKLILTVDHITPTVRGGENIDKNKQVTCWVCNQLKGALKHNEFKIYLSSLYKLKDLNKVKVDIGNLSVLFHYHAFPKSLEDLNKSPEISKEVIK